MSYHIYTTRALVLRARAKREADKIYSLFTRDFGLIRASAGGVRKETSKLRGSLEPIVLSNVSLVRGKEYWRITSAEVIQRIKSDQRTARPLALLEDLIAGEEAHVELYDAVEKSVASTPDTDEMFEVRLVATILYHLGYLVESDLTLPQKELIKAINKGLKASDLTN